MALAETSETQFAKEKSHFRVDEYRQEKAIIDAEQKQKKEQEEREI